MAAAPDPRTELKSPITSGTPLGLGCMAVCLVIGGASAIIAGTMDVRWLWAIVAAAVVIASFTVSTLGRYAKCPRCAKDLVIPQNNDVAWCGGCEDYWLLKERTVVPVPLGHRASRNGFAVSLRGRPEAWKWPVMCLWCGRAPTNHYRLQGYMMTGATGTSVQYRELSLQIPFCADHRVEQSGYHPSSAIGGVELEPGYSTRIAIRSYDYWKELIRLNKGIAEPAPPF
jgi:hypothetical protein